MSLSMLVGVLAHLVPVLFLQFSIRRIGSVLASIILISELPLTIVLALLIFQEPMKPAQIAGIILIVAGIAYTNWKEWVKPPDEPHPAAAKDS